MQKKILIFPKLLDFRAFFEKSVFLENGHGRHQMVAMHRGVVTLCAPRARARAVFGPDKCKDLCGHGQFLLRNVPEKDFESFEL